MLVLLSLASRGQENILRDFRLIPTEEGIRVHWTIEGGEQCNGVDVFRGQGQGAFQEIGGIKGICGGNDFPTPYDYLDSLPPKNVELQYFLKLGNQGFSDTLVATHFQVEQKVLVYPHPVNASSRLVVGGDATTESELVIYPLIGGKFRTLLFQKYVELGNLGLQTGVYMYQVKPAGQAPVSGKILVP